MVQKHPICPDRIRKVPKQFSWVDHRLVRDRHIDQCSHQAAALYLFLVTVADAQGLSYYSDRSISKRLSMDESLLSRSRIELTRLGLVAYKAPIYQVLGLDARTQNTNRPTTGQMQSLAQIFKHIGQEAS